MHTLEGNPITLADGAVIDAPAEGLPDSTDKLFARSQSAGMPLLFCDMNITRRLRAHIVVDATMRTVHAYKDMLEACDACIAAGASKVYIVDCMERTIMNGMILPLRSYTVRSE